MRASRQLDALLDRLQREGRCTIRQAGSMIEPTAIVADDVAEEDFQADVVKLAKRHGWLVYHTRDSRKSASGFPDLVLIRGQVLVVAELKTATGEASADQRTWLEAFQAAGVRAFLWRPADWPAIAAVLTAPPN